VSEDADGFTWEGIIRAVTMAGRPDRVFELQLAYNRYFQILDAASRTLRDIRGRLSEKDWSGTGADAYRKHYDSLVKAIDTFYEKTSKVVELSGDTGGALARAIADIPLPDMGDLDHLGMHGIQYSDAETGNQVQYHFFRTHRDRYDDGGFLDYVNQQIGGKPDPSQNNFRGSANPNAQRYANARRWYAEGTRQARAAFGTLLAAYNEQTYAIPTYSGGDAFQSDPLFGSNDGDGSGGHGGGRYDGGSYGGLGAGVGTGAGPSIGRPPAPVDGSVGRDQAGEAAGRSHAAMHGPTAWDDQQGSRLAGGGFPTTGVHAGGSGSDGLDVGGAPSYGGGGTAGYDPAVRYGDAPVPTAANADAGSLSPGRGGSARGTSSTYGVPGSGGSGGRKERDEHRSWLTEDDEDIWRGVPLGPPSVIE
jgi:hypothetical protein